MKLLSVVGILFSASSLSAALIPGLNPDQAVCFGRDYSSKHMSEHPKQTVKLMKLKFAEVPDSGEGVTMEIQTHLKTTQKSEAGDEYELLKPYIANMWCSEASPGKLDCGIECDGGTAKVSWAVSNSTPGKIRFSNQGFMMQGGCGEDPEATEEVRLERTTGGDDEFDLYRLPSEFCQK